MYWFLTKKIIIYSLCLLLYPTLYLVGFAEERTSLTLEDAFQFAAKNNPQFKAKTVELNISKAQIKTAEARQNPAIVSDSGIAENTYRAGISYTVELGGKRGKRKRLAKTEFKAAEKTLNTEWLDFRGKIRQAYTQLYYAQQRLDILKQVQENSQRLLWVAEKREQVGDIPKMSVLQAEITDITTQNELEKARYQFHETHHQLAYLLNIKLDEHVQLAPPNNTPDFSTDPTITPIDTLVEEALKNRPEIQSIQINQDITQHQLKLAKAERIPNLQLSAGPDIVTGEGGKTSAFITAQMSIPLFNRQQGAIEAAQVRQEKVALELEALQNKVKTEVEHAYLAYSFHQKMLKRYETELLPKAEIVAQKSRRSFEVGKSPIWVPLNAQSAYMETQLNYLQVLTDYQQAIGMLERAMGTGL